MLDELLNIDIEKIRDLGGENGAQPVQRSESNWKSRWIFHLYHSESMPRD